MENISIIRLEGPMRIAFKTEDKKVYARALEFDLVGIGGSRDAARSELQSLFRIYLLSCLSKPGKVQFLFPSDPDEWNNPDIEAYEVVVKIKRNARSQQLPGRLKIKDLRKSQKSIQSIDLMAIC